MLVINKKLIMVNHHIDNILKSLKLIDYNIIENQTDFDSSNFELNIGNSIAVKCSVVIIIKSTAVISNWTKLQVQLKSESNPAVIFNGFEFYHFSYNSENYLQLKSESLVNLKGIIKGKLVYPSSGTLLKACIKTTMITPI